mgnify:FL=1
MDLNTFFEHFDTLAEAPNGLQRLRELILDMAVRGKLVPQDPEDEPANGIDSKISEKFSYSIPSAWQWQELGSLINFVNGFAFKSNEFISQGIGVIRIGDIFNGNHCQRFYEIC